MLVKLDHFYVPDRLYLFSSLVLPVFLSFLFFNFKILFIFRERGMAGEREAEKHQYVLPAVHALLGT